jgi:hypothetical protein
MKQTYICILNGKFYGSGSLAYMNELFTDYVNKHQLYGKDEVEFKIIKKKPETFKELREQLAIKTAPNHGLKKLHDRG